MTRPFVHPQMDDVSLESVLYALADPARLAIIQCLTNQGCAMNCSAAAPETLAKSTQSHHYRILRDAGIIRSERRGTEVINSLRCKEIEKKFPGVIATILKAAAKK